MRALKTFTITLAVILAVGAIGLIAGSAIKKHNSAEGGSGSVTSGSTSSEDGSGKSSSKAKANPVKKAIVSKAMDAYLDSADGKAKEIADSITEEDKDAVAEIIASNISVDSISDVQDLIGSGDKEGLTDYVEENFSEEDQAELKEILSKYVEQP